MQKKKVFTLTGGGFWLMPKKSKCTNREMETKHFCWLSCDAANTELVWRLFMLTVSFLGFFFTQLHGWSKKKKEDEKKKSLIPLTLSQISTCQLILFLVCDLSCDSHVTLPTLPYKQADWLTYHAEGAKQTVTPCELNISEKKVHASRRCSYFRWA